MGLFFGDSNEERRLRNLLNKREEEHKEEVSKMQFSHNEKIDKLNQKHADEVEREKNRHEDEIARVVSNQDVALATKTAALTAEKQQLTIDKQTLTQKVEMYETAFKNLGFDVKDMKDILNKLVDGIVSKNKIQMVK